LLTNFQFGFAGEGGYGGGQGAHPGSVYAAAGQNNNAGQMRAGMQPPNPSSTPPGQQQPQQLSAAELNKGPQHLQQTLAGNVNKFFSEAYKRKLLHCKNKISLWHCVYS